jgi:hypothetical protein
LIPGSLLQGGSFWDWLENDIFIDYTSLFDYGRRVAAVFNRNAALDLDVAFKIDIAFDIDGFAIYQRRQSLLKAFLQKVNFSIKFRIQPYFDSIRSAGRQSFGSDPQIIFFSQDITI